ncbi:MAG: CRISPR-associated CARF protein Csa3 [Desulfurococcales archaeon]|nr:CRISPR-associated CARF protein Csa3 [Desulfurococcales archaeon]
MARALVTTIGFDERFVVRALIRYLENIDHFIGILSTPIEQRALQAISNIKNFIDKYVVDSGKRLAYEFIEIDITDPYEAIAKLKRIFTSNNEYVVNLSGGMRALTIVTFIAFIISRARGEIEIELENLQGRISIDPRIITAGPLSSDEEKIVNTIKKLGRATYRDIMKETGIPRATLFKHLSSLRSRGVIDQQREGRNTYYMLTNIGRSLSDPEKQI